MAGSNKATKKTGVTHFPLQEEKTQQRVPPRGDEMKGIPQSGRKRGTKSEASRSADEQTITSRGAKGGKSGGLRAGLVSSSKKNSRT
jgi:hypothetical protein